MTAILIKDALKSNKLSTTMEIQREFVEHIKSMAFYGPVEYRSYIKSPEWKSKSEQIKQERGFRCQLCNVSGYVITLHVHHNTYERIGNELDSDLVVLCSDCHQLFHDHKKPQANKIPLSDKDIRRILHYHGINSKNNEPWEYYSVGKEIIQHIIDGYNSEFYDKYNGVNIDIVFEAIARINKELENDNGE